MYFLYVCNSKEMKELFASTLNGIPASVGSMSFMIVVLNAKFARIIAALTNKENGEKRRSPTKVPCFAS